MTGMAATTIDEYLDGISAEGRARIASIRSLVTELAPGATETMKYGMPTFEILGRHRIYAAAWERHVGVYPVHGAPEPLESELAPLRAAKDTVRFRFRDPFDEGLARRLIEFLLQP
jgi:uncharacterized protein YdhG (YjbR/CyaY superfamily)